MGKKKFENGKKNKNTLAKPNYRSPSLWDIRETIPDGGQCRPPVILNFISVLFFLVGRCLILFFFLLGGEKLFFLKVN